MPPSARILGTCALVQGVLENYRQRVVIRYSLSSERGEGRTLPTSRLRRASGVPSKLASFPMRTFRTADAAIAYAHPAPQLRRLEQLGSLHRLAHGYYTVVPQDQVGTDWMPTLEA